VKLARSRWKQVKFCAEVIVARTMATATATRRLAAILSADVVGYSRLMSADEEGTHERLKAHLVELVDPKIREHHGRIVKTTGDGVLAEFPSVVDAVRSAAEIQRSMADRDLDLAEERRLRFRIGLNLGDVIADGGDIYGDGVNIAARLEGLATPGGICISGTVRDHIGDRLPYVFENMGEQRVKNIARPVRVYALRAEDTAGAPTASGSASVSSSPPFAAPRLSIVALPFTNLSDDREQQYFADGITEDLTTDLSRIENMFVISRNTAFTYRNKFIDTKQMGRELGVRYVLEGSVRRLANQLRVNAQLTMPRPMRISGPSVSTATRSICSPCKTRSRAGSPSRSALSWLVRRPPDRPIIQTRWITFCGDALRR
jgi:adenylate cyclase